MDFYWLVQHSPIVWVNQSFYEYFQDDKTLYNNNKPIKLSHKQKKSIKFFLPSNKFRTSSDGATAKLCKLTSFISLTSCSTCFFFSAMAFSIIATSCFKLSVVLFDDSAIWTAESISLWIRSTSVRKCLSICCLK